MIICENSKCTGCYACANACSLNCIQLSEDEFGEIHPEVDESRCINCGKCQRTCPANKDIQFNYPLSCYAAWEMDYTKRCECASGGIATAISEYVIRCKKGVVFGTAYDKELIPRTIYVESIEGIEKLKGSKYVQSDVGIDTYRKMKEFLEEGRVVLYVATPCQIAAANSFCGEYENFFTVDLICHGVCPTKYLTDEVNYIIKKKSLKDVVNIRFRGNDNNNYNMTLWDSVKKNNNFVMTLWKKIGGGAGENI